MKASGRVLLKITNSVSHQSSDSFLRELDFFPCHRKLVCLLMFYPPSLFLVAISFPVLPLVPLKAFFLPSSCVFSVAVSPSAFPSSLVSLHFPHSFLHFLIVYSPLCSLAFLLSLHPFSFAAVSPPAVCASLRFFLVFFPPPCFRLPTLSPCRGLSIQSSHLSAYFSSPTSSSSLV